MPAPQTLGNFTANVPRLSQKGPPTIRKGDKTATDVYTVWIPGGLHPIEAGVSGIPDIGDAWDIDDSYICESVTWANTFPSEIWTASVQYKVPKSTGTDDPEDEPPEGTKLMRVSYYPTTWMKDLEFDIVDGRAVQNICQDRFQDALRTELYTTSLEVVIRSGDVPIDALTSCQGTINEKVITVGGIEIQPTCGLMTISCKETDDEEYPFETTYNIKVTSNVLKQGYVVEGYGQATEVPQGGFELGFRVAELNVGYRYYEGTVEVKKVRFKDNTPEGGKALAVDPQVLDENGEKADDGKAYWMIFNRYPVVDWEDNGVDWLPKGKPSGGN